MRKFHVVLIVAACSFAVCSTLSTVSQPSNALEVQTESGPVRGVAKGNVIAWKGIPYAAPPVGILRWRVPQKALAWTAVRDASQFGPACLQADDVPKSEDCLTLNIWRPAAAPSALPVMVWIYGGAMVHGNAAMYPGDALAAQGVVVVNFNYRLGRFGFFAHQALAQESPDDVRGNYGFMDQLAALQWVQRNIAAFAGDPKSVTIFGESAGGGAVMAHLESPLSRGLFARAILQSPGTPGARANETPSTDLAAAEKMADDWARSAGVTADGAAAIEQLRALPT
jgi:para-nitrobenzyl esterase